MSLLWKVHYFNIDSPGTKQARILYDFTAEPGNNELSVREGETVTVIDQVMQRLDHTGTHLCTLGANTFVLLSLSVEAGSLPRTPADEPDWYLRSIYR